MSSFLRRLSSSLIAAAVLAGVASAQERLPAPVLQALRAAGVPPDSVAAVVQEVGKARPSLSHNAASPMNPASVIKLVTTYAGLELLGPAYRWKTEAYAAGTVTGDALLGHLVLKGYGDPKLSLESFWLMLRHLRERGLREIRGEVVLDRTYFEAQPYDPGRFDAEPLRPYNVGPDALLVSYKSVRFSFLPDLERGTVRVVAEPWPATLDVVSVVRLAEGACGEWREKLSARFEPPPRAPQRIRALFSGPYAKSCGEQQWNVALFSHPDYVAGVFRALWEELGGTWTGAWRPGSVPAGARLLYTHESPALAEVVRDINKFSNNVMARQLYLTLGAETAGPPARAETAFQAVRAWLAQKGLDAPELVIENGAGLSRIARISAHSLSQLLLAAYRSPVMPEFISSLPLLAVDGTLRKRMTGEPVAGQAHIKGGTLAEVRAIAGYVLDREGRRHVVVMMINHPNAPLAQPALDALLSWVHDAAPR